MSSGSASMVPAGSSSLYTIDKLNSSNFSSWKFRMQMILIDRGLWEIVDGTQVAPVVTSGDEASQAKLVDWKKKDNTARAQIALTVGNSELVHIKAAKTSREVWTKICSVFEAKGLAARIFLRRKFFNIKLKEGDGMQAHINQVRELAEQLDAIGAPVTDSDIAMTLLCSLPEQYDSLIVALESRPSDDLTSEFVASRLLAEEKRRQESFNVKVNGTAEAAFVGNQLSGGDKKKSKRCKFCKSIGHTEDTCYRKHGYPVGHPLHQKSNMAAVTKLNESGDIHSEAWSGNHEEFLAFTGAIDGPLGKHEWVVDSGASAHYCNNRDWFRTFKGIPAKKITLGDNHFIQATGIGDIPIKVVVDNHIRNGIVTNVLYVPDMGYNLLSVFKLVQSGFKVSFFDDHCLISDKTDKVLAQAKHGQGNLYRLSVQPIVGNDHSALVSHSASGTNSNAKLWHERLGHLNYDSMKQLKAHQLVNDFPLNIHTESNSSKISQCEGCVIGKAHRATMPSAATHRANKLLEIVHTDVCGPMNVASLGSAIYFATFIDDYSRFIVVKLMKSKGEVMEHFMKYRLWAENITNHRIKILRSDNGGEYCSKEFDQLLSLSGISRQKSPPYTPEHNGVAERANRTIVECARSLLHGAHLNYSFWGEAVMTAVYLRNRSPSSALQNITPFEAWTGEKPSLGHLKVFGCKAFVHIPDQLRAKLEIKAIECIMVGYSLESKAYRCYDPVKRRVVISRDVTFFENQAYNSDSDMEEIIGGGEVEKPNNDVIPFNDPPSHSVSDSAEETKEQQPITKSGLSGNNNNNDNGPPQVRSSTRFRQSPLPLWITDSQRHPPEVPLYDEYRQIIRDARDSASATVAWTESDNNNNESLNALISSRETESEPISFTHAMSRSNAKQWKEAAQDEFDSIQSAGTWSLVSLPNGRTPIGCKWVFKVKHNADGSIERYKARLVAKGYSQKEGIDFNETFAPVAKFSSIRALLALAAIYDLELHQMDVKTAFLNGDLEEDIYMVQPEGFVVKGKEHLVCKLNKSLYGLKQASRAWYQKMDQALIDMHFKRLQTDACVYVHRTGTLVIFVALYVDDLLLLSNSLSKLNSLKEELAGRFEMKDLGEAHFILGIQIERDRSARTLSLSQQAYIAKIVERYGMTNSKPVATPLDHGAKLSKADSPTTDQQSAEMKNIPYQSAVGAIMYAMLGSRPDIAYAVTILSQFNSNPGLQHWSAVKRVLRYLNGTMTYKLAYGAESDYTISPTLMGYCDADWASNIDDRKSITGYVFMLAGGAVSWQTKKQPTVALSSVEAEYMAATQATKEAVWFRSFLNELGVANIMSSPTIIFSDSQGSIALSKNPEYHSRTKHIDVRHHFIREHVSFGTVIFKFVGTDRMAADVLTKPLAKNKHQEMLKIMGVKSTTSGSVESH